MMSSKSWLSKRFAKENEEVMQYAQNEDRLYAGACDQ